jgi:YbbR domain-containing protein
MKKILIQYLYIFIITLIMLCVFISVNACEVEEVQDTTLPICEEYEVSTEEKPCRKGEDILTVIEAIEKLGESGTLPR